MLSELPGVTQQMGGGSWRSLLALYCSVAVAALSTPSSPFVSTYHSLRDREREKDQFNLIPDGDFQEVKVLF